MTKLGNGSGRKAKLRRCLFNKSDDAHTEAVASRFATGARQVRPIPQESQAYRSTVASALETSKLFCGSKSRLERMPRQPAKAFREAGCIAIVVTGADFRAATGFPVRNREGSQ